jgi:hypothetical protein
MAESNPPPTSHVSRRQLAVIALTVAALYVAACTSPALYLDESIPRDDIPFDTGTWLGWKCLLHGYWFFPPWAANFLLLVGLRALLSRGFMFARACGIGAFLLGLMMWMVLNDTQLLIGYYLWQASHITLAVGAAWLLARSRKSALE